jgi:PPOX class probable F420-dependent enzyme
MRALLVYDNKGGHTMSADLRRALERYIQWFGTYAKSGELKLTQVWLTMNDGRIEFLTPSDSYKVKRLKRDSRAVSYIGAKDGPEIKGKAEIITDKDTMNRVYRAYWKTHPIVMLLLWIPISRRIKRGGQVAIRVTPDDPNLLAGITIPPV